MYWCLLGVLVVIIGFAIKLEPIAIIVVSAIVTAIFGGINVIDLLETVGTTFVANRNQLITIILMILTGTLERNGLKEAAAEMRATLKGSYLWNFDKTRALQDPLSFRTTVYTISEAKRALKELDELVNIQINSSDDNPGVILNASKEDFDKTQVKQYFVDKDGVKGAIIPSANFEPLPIAIAAQRATIALSHVSHNALHRTMRLDEDRFSGLARYLAGPNNPNGHAFGATEDSMVSIYAENIELANPISMHGTPVEGNIEDSASNLPRVAERLKRASNNMFDLYSMELLHNTQAIDLRKMKQDNVKLSDKTGALYNAYRKVVPFVEKDRIFSGDLENGIKILKSWEVK